MVFYRFSYALSHLIPHLVYDSGVEITGDCGGLELTKKAIIKAVNEATSNTETGFGRGRHGMRLRIKPGEGGYWLQNVNVNGRRVQLGIGRFPTVSVQDAAKIAAKHAALARQGADPRLAKAAKRAVPTFNEIICDLLEMKRREAGEAHVDKMRRILAANIQTKLGSRRVDAIRVEDIVRCLKPIWHSKPVLAKRAAMFSDQAMTFAKANGYDVDIAAANAKVLAKALGRQKRCVNHFRALDPKDVPAAYAAIETCSAELVSKLALQFLILTAARPGEICGARWSEMEVPNAVWRIPGERMKAGVEHRIPLSGEAMALLEQARAIGKGGYVFGAGGMPLGSATMLKILKREGVDSTPHGFRSSFRQWCQSEGVPFEVAEAALAHRPTEAVVRAYARSVYFDERRGTMDAYATHVCSWT